MLAVVVLLVIQVMEQVEQAAAEMELLLDLQVLEEEGEVLELRLLLEALAQSFSN